MALPVTVPRETSVGVKGGCVPGGPRCSRRVDVHGCVREVRKEVEQPVARLRSDGVTFLHGQVSLDGEIDLRIDPVP